MAQDRLNLWFAFALVASLTLVGFTALHPLLEGGDGLLLSLAQKFRLTIENSPGSWWSAMLLALAAAHALDGRALWRSRAPALAQGWTLIALLCFGLSADEMSSGHERLVLNDYRLLLVAGGLVGLAILVCALVLLHAAGGADRRAARLVGAAFLLFALVPVQEYFQPMFEQMAPSVQALRAITEEGSELAGILLLLRASMRNTVALAEDGAPPFHAVTAYRRAAVAGALVLAPLAAALTAWLARIDNQGQPADWLASVLFFGAMLIPARRLVAGGARPADALLAAALLLCSAVMPLEPAPRALPLIGDVFALRSVILLAVVTAVLIIATLRWRGAPGPVLAGAVAVVAVALLPFLVPASMALQFLLPPLLGVVAYAVIAACEAPVAAGGAAGAAVYADPPFTG